MAISYQQTNTNANASAIAALCSGASLNTDTESCLASDGGSTGSTERIVTIDSGASTLAATWFEITVDAGVSWDAGTWTVRLNCTTGSHAVTLEEVHICRVNSSYTNQATIGSATGLALSTNGGVLAPTVSGSAQTPSAGDKVVCVLVFSESSGMGTVDIGWTPDQIITAPFTVASATVSQDHWRLYNDDGSESASTAVFAEDTSGDMLASTGGSKKYQLRILLQETGGVSAAASTFQLQYNNTTQVTGWLNVTGTAADVQAIASSNLTDDGTTTSRLAGGAGTFIAGRIDEADGATTTNVTITANNHTELVFNIQIPFDQVADNDVIQFRVTSPQYTITYNTTPQHTVHEPTPSFTMARFRFRNDDGSETGATWVDTENTNSTLDVDTNYRIRLQVDETNQGIDNGYREYALQYSLNLASYQNVFGSSSVVVSTLSGNFAQGDTTTAQLTASTGDFLAGEMGENTFWLGGNQNIVFTNGQYTEVEFCFQVVSGDVVDSDSIRLRLIHRKDGGAETLLNSYSVTPTITVNEPSGTEYTQSVAGTLTTSGTLAQQIGKPVDGTLTSAGDLTRQAQKPLAGTLTSSGTLDTTKIAFQDVDGTLTSSGSLVKDAQKALAGVLTSAGTLARQAQKALSGTLSSAGTLVRDVQKQAAGTLTSSGSLNAIKIALQSVAGTLTSSGALTAQAQKALSGTLTTAGTLVRDVQKQTVGVVTSAGALAREIQKALGGTLTSAGTVARQTQKALSGTLTTAGALTPEKQSTSSFSQSAAGTLTTSGSLATVYTAAPAVGAAVARGEVTFRERVVTFGARDLVTSRRDPAEATTTDSQPVRGGPVSFGKVKRGS